MEIPFSDGPRRFDLPTYQFNTEVKNTAGLFVEDDMDAVDLFVVDCKDMNGEIYRKYTGEDASVMQENLHFLLERTGPERVLVRVPLIPGYNTEEDQKKSAEALKKMGVEKLDLFEYVVRNQ